MLTARVEGGEQEEDEEQKLGEWVVEGLRKHPVNGPQRTMDTARERTWTNVQGPVTVWKDVNQ